ncbi:19568_t:CDS:1 [Funneliformis geosporum]|uniref:220_t:CDS:1 n=1 Tax=Funneliformis geosporum TaxID=1117311 RepID=A0A9W4X470_9GLOM|nr:19568_t:CDS:1 [Funneliformis geosporum]CAI2185269.1 220_t:CDS:1 [Funneliformis geosporum]
MNRQRNNRAANNQNRRDRVVERDNLVANINRARIFPPYVQNPNRILSLLRRNSRRPKRKYHGYDLIYVITKEEARIHNHVTDDIIVRNVANVLWRESTRGQKEQYISLARDVNYLI